jgi:hypothetical protein
METWLERKVQPMLTPMLHGERLVLDVEARVHLSAWGREGGDGGWICPATARAGKAEAARVHV